MLTVILIITVSLCAVLTVIVTIMTITGRSTCSANIQIWCTWSANSYCDNNGEVYMQC